MALKKFVVVKFTDERDEETGLPVVDLVSRRWLSGGTFNDDEEQAWNCAYPPPPYTNMIRMIKSQQQAGLTWKEFKAVIIGSSGKMLDGILVVLTVELSLVYLLRMVVLVCLLEVRSH